MEGTEDFEAWLAHHNGVTTLPQQVALAMELYDSAYGPHHLQQPDRYSVSDIIRNMKNAETHPDGLVSWTGVSVDWVLDHFFRTKYVQKLVEYRCELWFVRKVCIPEYIRREKNNRVWSGALVSHLEDDVKGKATTFLSYTGRYKLSCLVDMLTSLRGEYIWFDLFCVDQFAWTGRNESAAVEQMKKNLTDGLGGNIATISKTVLVLESWRDVNYTLGQIWVLWEIYNTAKVGANFSILLADNELHDFLFTLGNRPLDEVESALASINVEYSHASDNGDRENILNEMRKIGFHGVNRTVSASIRDWFVQVANNFIQENQADHHFRSNLGRLLLFEGRLIDGTSHLEDNWKSLRETRGEDHAETLMAQGNYALGLKQQGNHDSAELLYRDAIDRAEQQLRRSVQGFQRTNTTDEFNGTTLNTNGDGVFVGVLLNVYNNLGRLLCEDGRMEEASRFYNASLALCQEWLGEMHHVTIEVQRNIAILQRQEIQREQRQPTAQENEALVESYEESLVHLRNQRGERHPATMKALQSLGTLYRTHHRYDDARICFQEALDTQCEVLGAAHNDTLQTMSAFAGLKMATGEIEDANAMYRRAQGIYLQTDGLGNRHPDFLTLLSNWGVQLVNHERLEEAGPLLHDAFQGRLEVLGEAHPDTQSSLENLRCFQIAQMVDDHIQVTRETRTAKRKRKSRCSKFFRAFFKF